jgi:hypothetical protein
MTYVAVYVDDMLLFGQTMAEIDEIKRIIAQRFDIDDRGEVEFILGMKVERNRRERTIKIHHQRYVEQIVTKYGLKGSTCRFGKPLPQGFVIAQEEPCEVSHQTYQSAIGSLMYFAHWSRQLSQSFRSDGEWSMARSSTCVVLFKHDP